MGATKSVVKKGTDLVVLMHGFWGHRVQLLPMAAALSRDNSILNYGYTSRALLLQEHAESLVDAVRTRVSNTRPRNVHFVTHSFGGVVLRSAFGNGLEEELPNCSKTRCALIAPPLRGAAIARTLERMDLRAPESVRRSVRMVTRSLMGTRSGMQLRTEGPEWFDNVGTFPDSARILIVAGSMGRINPLLDDPDSDGIIAVRETMLPHPHRRLYFALTHNAMLVSPQVIRHVAQFLAGDDVGIHHAGEPLIS